MVRGVHVGLLREQEADDVYVTLAGGGVQRRAQVVVDRVHVAAELDQAHHTLKLALAR